MSQKDIASRVQDVNKQLQEIEAQIASWEENKQILAGIVQYLEWSEGMLEDGLRVQKQEKAELSNLGDLIDQRRSDYEKAKKDLVSARTEYGKSIKAVIASQEKQIGAMRTHEE